MGDFNIDLTTEQTNAGPIKVVYTFTTPVDPRAAIVIASDFVVWLGVQGYHIDPPEPPRVGEPKPSFPELAAQFIEQWKDRP